MTRPHRVLVLAALTGVLVGSAVAAFEQVVGRWLLEWTLDLPTGLWFAAPAVGVALAWLALRFVGRGASPAMADEYLDAYHRHGDTGDGDVPAGPVAGRTLAAASTLGLGGAMGFEGPSIYLGAAIGSFVRRRFPHTIDGDDQRALLVAGTAVEVVVNSDTLLFPVIGAAAFLGAGFRTPIAAIVFVAEVDQVVGDARAALTASGAAYVSVVDGDVVVGVVTPAAILALDH